MTTERVKLTGAQATRVREALARYEDNNKMYDSRTAGWAQNQPLHIVVEDLVNDILEVVGR